MRPERDLVDGVVFLWVSLETNHRQVTLRKYIHLWHGQRACLVGLAVLAGSLKSETRASQQVAFSRLRGSSDRAQQRPAT